MRNVLKTPRGGAWGRVDSVGAGGEGDGSVRGGTATPSKPHPKVLNSDNQMSPRFEGVYWDYEKSSACGAVVHLVGHCKKRPKI